jgi:PAS domain S-box-containing protein
MMPRAKNLWKHIAVPLLAVATIALINFLSRTDYRIPPVAPLLFLVVLASYYGGVIATLITSILTWSYLVYISVSPDSLSYNPDDSTIRVVIWSLSVPAIGLLVSVLKRRSEAPLKLQLKALEISKNALKESEERFRTIVSSAHDALIVINDESKIQEWNPQAEVTFGWSRSEALNKELSALIIPERYRAAHVRGLAHYMKTGDGPVLNRRFEITGLTRDGVEIPVELIIYPFKQGNKTYFGSFLHDISEKKRADKNQSIHLSITKIMTEVTRLTDAIPLFLETITHGLDFQAAELWLLDRDHKLTCHGVWPPNPSPHLKAFQEASKEMSVQLDEATGRNTPFENRWLSDAPNDSNFLRHDLIRKTDLHTSITCRIYDGTDTYGFMNFFSERILPEDKKTLESITDAGHKIGLFVRRRIAEDELATLNRNLEANVEQRTQDLAIANQQLSREIDEKRALYEQAQTANRLKDEFLATVSHELRTPLNVIMGYSEMLCNEQLSEEEMRLYFETIHRNAQVQTQIVNDILDISRIVTGKLRLNIDDVDISQVVLAAIGSVDHAAHAKNIKIMTHIDPMTTTVAGDFGRLQQVLWNLISNSIKFTPRYGNIDITTSVIESQVKISVKDSGLGIDSEFLPYVFERFRQEDATTTRKFGGLGLGLSIVRNIVELHGGSIEAKSAGKNKGSTFTVTLPVHALKVQAGINDEKTLAPKVHPLKNLRILVVEDQIDALNLIAKVLTRAGAEVYTANSAADGLQKVIKMKPQLLVSDIGMPEQDGYYLIQMIRKLPPEHGGNIPAIALTAYAHEEDHDRALREGFQVHVPKPVEGALLVSIVADLASRRPPEKPLAAPV